MIIVDYSQIVIAAVYADAKSPNSDFEINEDLIRHIILNQLRSINMKFRHTHGKIVLAVDGRDYWRKELFLNYKGTRKAKKAKESKFDWKQLYSVMNKVRQEIDENIPFIVLQVDRCEADDIVSSLVDWSLDNTQDNGSLFDEPEPIKILSGDGDFVQLQKHKHVSQYNSVAEKNVVPVVSPYYDLNFKCITGDTGDGICNIKSDENCLMDSIRQKSIKTEEKDSWSKNPRLIPEEYQKRYLENVALIDLSKIPQNYKDQIVSEYEKKLKIEKSLTLTYEYFKRAGLHSMLQYIHDFQRTHPCNNF